MSRTCPDLQMESVCVVLLENPGLSHGRKDKVFTMKKPKFGEGWRRAKEGKIAELRYTFKLFRKKMSFRVESLLPINTAFGSNVRTHQLPQLRVPGWGAIEAVAGLYCARFRVVTQLISKDNHLVHLSRE